MESQLVLVVNLDIAFLVNLITDLTWLWAAGALAGVRVRLWRLVVAAAFGATLAVWSYYPTGRWLAAAPGLLLGSLLMPALAYAPCRPLQAVKVLACLLLSGAAMAGIAMPGVGTADGALGVAGAIIRQLPSALVSTGLLLFLLGARCLWVAFGERAELRRGLYRLRVHMGDREAELPALLDTGHMLREPLLGTPVAIAEIAALSAILPPEVLQAVDRGWEALAGLPAQWRQRFRLVPFQTVERPDGIMLALLPSKMAYRSPGAAQWVVVRGLLGLTGSALHSQGAFRALLPPCMLKGFDERQIGREKRGRVRADARLVDATEIGDQMGIGDASPSGHALSDETWVVPR